MKKIKILSAIAVAASATLPAFAALDPDCVLYYDFETLAEDGYKVENIANPGVMQLDGKRLSLANVVEATPSAKIRQTRAATPADDSSHTLRYVQEGEVYDGRYCTPPDGTDYFATTNFTIELFYKIDGSVAAWHSMFKRFGANNIQVNLGVGGANKLSAQVMTGEVPSSYETKTINDSQVTNDDKWHHAALVVDQTGESKTMRLYRDYKLIGTQELATKLTSAVRGGEGGDQRWYVIGSGDKYEFNGWLDSVRVTLRALEPQEFLWGEGMSIGRFPAGSTLAHVKFDGSLNAADADGGTFLNGVNVAAKDGGTPAAFTNDVPGARIIDGLDGEVISKNNTKSLSLSDSKVTWSDANDVYYLRKTLAGDDRTSWTVEFFMKATSSQPQWAHVVNALKNGSWSSGYPYMIQFYNKDGNRISLRGSGNSPLIDYNVNVCDGKWHHVAFTFAPNADDPDTTSDVNFYVDYGQENGGWTGTATTTSDRVHPDSLHFVVGGGKTTDNCYNGLMDELRVSAGALTPSQFLRAERAPGLSIFVR